MKIKDIAIKKIEGLPAHVLIRVSEMIDVIAGEEVVHEVSNGKRGELHALGVRSRVLLAGLSGSLGDDIVTVERDERR